MTPHTLPEFTVFLDQRPGELAGILGAAAASGVEVRGFWVGEHKGRGVVRVIGEPVDALRAMCESMMESGVGPLIESEVLGFETGGRPNSLRDLAVAFGDRGLNIRYAYVLPSRAGSPELCVLRVDDVEDALKQASSIDWPVAAVAGKSEG